MNVVTRVLKGSFLKGERADIDGRNEIVEEVVSESQRAVGADDVQARGAGRTQEVEHRGVEE